MAKVADIELTDEELLTHLELEYRNALEFRRPRVVQWHQNEDLLYGKKPTTISKRSNIMVNFAAGFMDSLLARIKNPPVLTFGPTEEADTFSAKKVNALHKLDAGPNRADWEFKDLIAKKLGGPTGRAIYKIYSLPKPYRSFKELIDPYDFLIDPLAGGLDIEKARYMFQDNIVKSAYEIKSDKSYKQSVVTELLAMGGETNTIVNNDNYNNENRHRLDVTGLDPRRFNLVSQGGYKLTEGFTTIAGERYYALFSLEYRKVLKRTKLVNVFSPEKKNEQPLWPFRSWAYYPDAFNFWSLSPIDLVRELFMTRNVVINQIVDNNEAKNKPQRAYDPGTYLHPEKLEWRPDGLVPVAKGTDPKAGIHTFSTPDLYDPKLLSEILEDLVGKITGVSAAAMGGEDNKQRVGIYYGNMQEIAGRMSLFDLSYTRCNLQSGPLYLRGLRDHLTQPEAVRMIGEQGATWDYVSKEDLKEFDITVSGGIAQSQNDAMTAKAKTDFINQLLITPNQAITGTINYKFALEQGAINAGFTESEAKTLLDKDVEEEVSLVKASQDIQHLVLNETFRPYLKADPAYLQKIFDFRYENDLEPEVDQRISEYIEKMKTIVMQNVMIKAKGISMAVGLLANGGQPPVGPAEPATSPDAGQVPENMAGVTPLPQDPETQSGQVSQMAGEQSNMMKEQYQ